MLQWTYDAPKENDYAALLVNDGENVIGMVTGSMAEALYKILKDPPEMTDDQKLVVASRIPKKCEFGHTYVLTEASCPGCAVHAGMIDTNLSKLISAAKCACHNNDYKLHEDLRDALNPFQDNPK